MTLTPLITNAGLADIIANWIAAGYKVMLLDSTATSNRDYVYVSEINAKELDCSGYTKGYGNSGRQSLAGKAVSANQTDDRAEAVADDITWAALGTGATIGGFAIIKETGGSDATSLIITMGTLAANVPTNGSSFKLDFATSGLLQATDIT